MFRRKPAPDLIRGGYRFADKNMRQRMILEHGPIPKERDMSRFRSSPDLAARFDAEVCGAPFLASTYIIQAVERVAIRPGLIKGEGNVG
jgi:hypothetical protein